jgi:5'-methylthioadenosine phosphorylase
VTLQPLGIIAGTGFYDLDALDDAHRESVETAYGPVGVTRGTWHGQPVAFVTRHGAGHEVPPHRVNYRAIIRALADLGARDVLAVNVTGGIDPDLEPGELVCLDDFLDLTRRREGTFHDGEGSGGVVHTDMTNAYDPQLRRELLNPAAGVRPGEPITMDEIAEMLATGAPKVLAVVEELVHTRSVFGSDDTGAGTS